MTTAASDIMSTHLITVRDGSSIEEALKLLMNHQITGLPVVDDASRVVGVMSEFDLLSQLSEAGEPRADLLRQPARFSKAPKTVLPTTPLDELLTIFTQFKYRRLLVVDPAGALVGIVSRRDLIRLFYYRAHLS